MSAQSEAEDAILQVKDELGAASCTFYVRDPFWTDDLRLLFMPEVTVPEPMYGFLMPEKSRERIIGGDRLSLNHHDPSQPNAASQTLASLIERKPIFGDFQTRERVRSYVKLVFQDASREPIGSLCLNFHEHVEDSTYANWEPHLTRLYATIEGLLPALMRALDGEDPLPIRRLLRILSTVKHLLSVGDPRTDPIRTQQAYLDGLLDTVLDAYGIGAGDGFGTIHLYDPRTETLELRASRPGGLSLPPTQDCKSGQGTIAWAALRGRPILIPDLSDSQFVSQGVYVTVCEGIRQEIAIPMMEDGKVVGILNIESKQEVFKPEDVRLLWYAAGHAAVAFRLGKQLTVYNTLANRIRTLLDLCRETVADGPPVDPRKPDERLNRLADLLAQWNEASMCDIWGYAKESDEFWGVGASSEQINLELAPRAMGDGFSRLVIARKHAILINEIQVPDRFKALEWTGTDGSARWEPLADAPGSVSPGLKDLRVGAEIGVPMVGRDGVIGIAWLKFEAPFSKEPTAEEMKNVEGLAASVALIVDLLYKYDLSIKSSEQGLKKRLLQYYRDLMPPFPSIPGLEIHVRCESAGGAIGGDFFGWHTWVLDDRTDCRRDRIAVILGDGTGHGIEGALQMLPLYTSYRILRARTTSTHYVLEKMGEVAKDLNVDGTALYFILDSPKYGSTEWTVSATVAGDAPPLMIFDERSGMRLWPDNIEQVHTRFNVEVPPPLGEAVMKCGEGTVIVAVSDGVLDAGILDPGKDPFGPRGVALAVWGALQTDKSISSKGIADAVYEKARSYGTIHDDATVLVVRLMDPARVPAKSASAAGTASRRERPEPSNDGEQIAL